MFIFSDDDENQEENSVDSAPASTKPATSEAASPSGTQQTKESKDSTEQPPVSATADDVKMEVDDDATKTQTPAKRETRSARELRVRMQTVTIHCILTQT